MDLTDTEFLEAFESATLESFHHSDHVRLTLLYLQRYGMPEAETRVCDGIRSFARAKGAPEKYHHTMTVAFVRLAAHLLDKAALHHYYSPDLLASSLARTAFTEPDLRPLPQSPHPPPNSPAGPK